MYKTGKNANTTVSRHYERYGSIFMKFMCSLCASILVAVAILSVLPVSGEELIYSDTIRLHVIAASDAEDEQRLKLKVRDNILEYVSELTANINSKDEALEVIEKNIDTINQIAEDTVKENGYSHETETLIGLEDYPEREYDNFKLPTGEYVSLRVKIGAADGKNWWCVLFPPLCTTAASRQEEAFVSAGFTGEQYKVITKNESGRYKVKFKLLEIIEEIFG